jgi:ribonuclease P protein component
MPTPGTSGRFERTDRLLDSRDFRRVMRTGSRKASRDLVVFSTTKQEFPNKNRNLGSIRPDVSRIGITASRKVGNAVIRNQFKRRVREWFRTHRAELDPSVDLLVIARHSGARLDAAALDGRLRKLLGLGPGRE